MNRQLTGLSRKSGEAQITRSIEERTRKVLRENRHNPAHALAPLTDKNPSRYVRGGAVLMPKLKGAATPANASIWDRDTYRTGDGEIFQQMRPGADDALKCQSRGFST
jgi:hypothetical protein